MATQVQHVRKQATTTSVVVGSGDGWNAPTALNTIIAVVSTDTTVSTPTGFTSRAADLNNNSFYIFDKIAAGTETTITFPFTGGNGPCTVELFEYSGLLTAADFDAIGASSKLQNNAGQVSLAITGFTTAAGNGDLVFAAVSIHNLAGTPSAPSIDNGFALSGGTPLQSGSGATGAQLYVGIKDVAASTAVGTTTISWTGGVTNTAGRQWGYKKVSGGTNYTGTPVDPEGITDSATAVQANARTQADAEGITDSAISNADNARTQADAEGLADAASAVQALARTQADAEGITDSATSSTDGVRTQADAEGITDSALANQDLARTQADVVGITDNVATTFGPTRQQDDPEGITDAATATQAVARTQADAVGITDAATPVATAARTQADAVGITDSVTAVITGSFTEYPGFSDADLATLTDGNDTSLKSAATEAVVVTRTDVYAMGADLYCPVSAGTAVTVQLQTDTNADGVPDHVAASVVSATIVSATKLQVRFATPVLMTPSTYYWFVVWCDTGQTFRYGFVTDEFSTGGPHRPIAPADYQFPGITNVYFATSVETASGNGCFSTTLQFPNTNNSGIWLGISPVVGLAGGGGTDYTANPADAEGITDAASAAQDLVRTQADAVGITDSATASIGPTRQQDDAEGITDAASAMQANARTQGDAEGLTDSAAAVQALTRTQADAVGITDSVTATINGTDYVANISDSIGITDLGAPQQIDYGWTQSDGVGLADSTTGALDSARAQADAEGITDSASAAQALARTQGDAEGLTDAASAAQDAVRALSDAVGITDTVTAQLSGGGSISVSVTDSEGITDAASTVADVVQNLTDAVGITDSVTAVITHAFAVTQNDAVGITDATSPQMAAARVVVDTEGITDAVTAVITAPINYVVTITDSIGILDHATALGSHAVPLDLTFTLQPSPWGGSNLESQWGSSRLESQWGGSVARKGSS